MFDWLGFLNEQRIPFKDRGKNVQKGHLNIKCPFCGDDDPSEHMGLEISTGYWGCWRDATHRGKRPHRILMRILGKSYEEVDAIVSDGAAPTTWDELERDLHKVHEIWKRPLDTPVDLDPLFASVTNKGPTAPFWQYLRGRGFDRVDDLVAQYQLLCAWRGEWAGRLVVPLTRFFNLVGWTARSIHRRAEIRYRAHPEGDQVKRTLCNHDKLLDGGHVLALVEGPIDTLKLDFYGQDVGVRAGGMMGLSLTPAQIQLVLELAPRFRRTVIIVDGDALDKAFTLQSQLAPVGPQIATLPDGIGDPGEMTPMEAVEFARSL